MALPNEQYLMENGILMYSNETSPTSLFAKKYREYLLRDNEGFRAYKVLRENGSIRKIRELPLRRGSTHEKLAIRIWKAGRKKLK